MNADAATSALNRLWAWAIVDELIRGGVRHICVSPGSRSSPLALAIAERADDIGTSVHVDERSAAFFALGFAKASGTPVGLVCTSGSAGAHYLPAVIEAHMSRVPLVILTADRPPELRDTGAWQTIDQVGLFGRFARWSVDVPPPTPGLLRYARSVAARAVVAARGRPAGPVHLNLPFREPGPAPGAAPTPGPSPNTAGGGEKASPTVPATVAADLRSGYDDVATCGQPDGRPWVALPPSTTAADPATLDAIAELVRAEPRGLILAGLIDARPGYADAVARLAAASGYPILAEPTGGLRFGPHDRSRVITGYDAFLRAPRWCAEHGPGLVIRLGASFTWKYVAQYLERHPAAIQVVVDPDGTWDDPTRLAAMRVMADEVAACEGVAMRLEGAKSPSPTPPSPISMGEGGRGGEGWMEAWRGAMDVAARVVEGAVEHGGTDTVAWVYRALMAHIPDDAVLYAANSMAVRDVDTFTTPSAKPIRVIANRGAAGIDGTISSALGAGLGAGRPVVLVTGDLAFVHDLGGIAAARVPGIDAAIVVLNDDGGGIFAHLPIAGEDAAVFERFFRTPSGVDIGAACAAFGVPYRRVAGPADLAAALSDLGRGTGVRVIEVAIDVDANSALHRAMWKAVVDGIGG